MSDPATNVYAIEVTLTELKSLGRLESVDAAKVQALRSMAVALDENPAHAPLWRQYRDMLGEVLGAGDEANDGLAAALAEIRGSTKVGDSTTS